MEDVLDARKIKSIRNEKLLKIAAFCLKSCYFEFNGTVKEQMSDMVKCAPSYAFTFMTELETNFIESAK